jgi:hypothetical protein
MEARGPFLSSYVLMRHVQIALHWYRSFWSQNKSEFMDKENIKHNLHAVTGCHFQADSYTRYQRNNAHVT